MAANSSEGLGSQVGAYFEHLMPIPVDNLAPVIKDHGFPLTQVPTEVLDQVQQGMEEADRVAKAEYQRGLTQNDVVHLLDNSIKSRTARRENIDPFAVLQMLLALNKQFYPHDSSLGKLEAFGLMARATLNAPFMMEVNNEYKHNRGSYAFFSLLAHYKKSGLLLTQNKALQDHWQIYFHGHAYFMQPLPWLNGLYHFYVREAKWLNSLVDPFADPNFIEDLRMRISYRGLLFEPDALKQKHNEFNQQYINPQQQLVALIGQKQDELTALAEHYFCNYYADSDYVNSQRIINTDLRELELKLKAVALGGHKEVQFTEWLSQRYDRYEITDVNIYWHLLKKLAYKSEHVQNQFWNVMIEAKANPITLIDNKGTTPLELAMTYGLTTIQKLIAQYCGGSKCLFGTLSQRKAYKARPTLLSNGKRGYKFIIGRSSIDLHAENITPNNEDNNLLLVPNDKASKQKRVPIKKRPLPVENGREKRQRVSD